MRHGFALLTLATLLLTACSGGPTVDTVTVKGKVLKGGQPLKGSGAPEGAPPSMASYGAGYQLYFYHQDTQEGMATLDAQGSFTIDLPPNRTYKVVLLHSGAPPSMQQNSSGQNPTAGYSQMTGQADSALKKFADLKSTPIEIQVGDSPQEITIDLDKYN